MVVMAYGAHRLFFEFDDQGNTFDRMDVWVRSVDPRSESKVALTVQFLSCAGTIDTAASLEQWSTQWNNFSSSIQRPDIPGYSKNIVLNIPVDAPATGNGAATSEIAPAPSLPVAPSLVNPESDSRIHEATPLSPTTIGVSASSGSSSTDYGCTLQLSTPEEIRAAVLDLQSSLVIMERRNHPGEKGRWNRFDTARRKAILYRALPRVQAGNLRYGGYALDQAMIHGSAVPVGDELASFDKWSRGIYVDPRVKDIDDPTEIRRLLECAALHATMHSEVRVPPHRPPTADRLEYKLNWGTNRYKSFQGKTLREIGESSEAGVSFLQWIVSSEFTWNHSSNHAVMLLSVNRLIQDAVMFTKVSPPWKISWAPGACPFAMLSALTQPRRGRGRPRRSDPGARKDGNWDSSDDELEVRDRNELEKDATSPDDDVDESDETYGPGYYKITPQQKEAWDNIRLGRPNIYGANICEYATWPNPHIDPPDPASCLIDAATKPGASFRQVLLLCNLRRIYVLDQRVRYRVPMPCAFHGFECPTRRRGWNVKLRRISGVSEDEMLASGTYECISNFRLKQAALSAIKRLKASNHSSVEAIDAANSVYRAIRYQFKSIDQRVTKFYNSSTTYSWLAMKIPASIYRRTALSTELAMLMQRQATFQSANDLALMLRELKTQKHAQHKNLFYSLQILWRRTRSSSVTVSLDEPILTFPENYQDIGGSFVSTNFILDHTKVFYDQLAPWLADFHVSHFLTGDSLALDHHLKVGKGTVAAGIEYGQYKLSVFNNHGIVEATNFTSSASFEDPVTQATIRDHLAARHTSGAPEIQVVTIDNVYRDGLGVRTLFRAPSRHEMRPFVFPGKIRIISCSREDAEAEALMSRFTVIGLDTERVAYIPPVPRGPPGKPVAHVQLAGGSGANLVCCIYPVHITGFLPGLLRLLANSAIKKVVLNAQSDIAYLRHAGVKEITCVIELKSVVQKANPLPPLQSYSLKVLVAHPQLCEANINKSIPHELWETHELSPRQIEYMATDAYAHLAVYEAAEVLRISRYFNFLPHFLSVVSASTFFSSFHSYK